MQYDELWPHFEVTKEPDQARVRYFFGATRKFAVTCQNFSLGQKIFGYYRKVVSKDNIARVVEDTSP
jgi:hypothetical protein